MRNSKPIKPYKLVTKYISHVFSFFLRRGTIVVLGIISMILLCAGLILGKNYGQTLLIYFKKRNIVNACHTLVLPKYYQKNIILLLDTQKNGEHILINKIEYIIKENDSNQINLLSINKDLWIRTYFSKQSYAQVRYLFRAANQVSYKDCKIFNDLIYLTGIVPNKIIIKEHNGNNVTWYAKNIDFNDILNIIKIEQPNSLTIKNISITPSRVVLEDGSTIQAFTFSDIYPKIKSLVRLSNIVAEGVSVEIYNATGKVGYASFWSKVLKGEGFNIIRVGTALKPPLGGSDKTIYWIYTSNAVKNSASIQFLLDIFGKNYVYISNKRPSFMVTTADIVIFLLR